MKGHLAEARLLCMLVLVLLPGCTTTKGVSDEELRKIRVVSLDRNVLRVPPIYAGPREFGDYASRNGVLIDKIALEEFEAALRQAGKLKPLDSKPGTEPVMQLGVLVFGFAATDPPINSRFVPIVQIGCLPKQCCAIQSSLKVRGVQLPET